MLLGSGERKGNDIAGERKTEMEVGTRIRAALVGLVIPWPGDLSPKSLGIRSSPLFSPQSFHIPQSVSYIPGTPLEWYVRSRHKLLALLIE